MILETRSVDFGASRTGLATVGYTLGVAPRSTDGVTELVPGSGIYGATILRDESLAGAILWDTGGGSPAYAAEEINPDGATSLYKVVSLGSARGGLATVGYTVTGLPRSTTGVAELGTASGIYGATVDFGGNFDGYLTWDTGGGSPVYAAEAVNTPTFAPPEPGTGLRDWDVLQAIRDALVATNEFDANAVHFAFSPDEQGSSSGQGNAAWLEKAGWTETDESDDPGDVQSTRHLEFTLTIATRREDPEARDRELDRLENVAANAINGRSLGGLTIAGWTKLGRARWRESDAPERRSVISGTAAYFVDGDDAHSTSD